MRRPAKLTVDRVGRNSRYTLLCQVVSDDGLGIPAALMFVDEVTQEVKEQATGEQGFLSYPIELSEPKNKITIRVKGTDIGVRMTLFGPRLHKRVPPPTAEDLKGSLWEVFKRGRQKRRELERGK